VNWIDRHWLHLILIGLYLIVLVRHALHGKRNVSSIADYLVAGRRMGGVVIALSFYATFMSTNTFIGAAGKSWTYGLSWCVGGVVLTALAAISWFVVAPRFVPLTKKYQSLTVADFAGFHYDSQSVRRIAAVIKPFHTNSPRDNAIWSKNSIFISPGIEMMRIKPIRIRGKSQVNRGAHSTRIVLNLVLEIGRTPFLPLGFKD